MESLVYIIGWILVGMTMLGWGSILFCWSLFGYAKYKGWLTDDMTPAQILDRIAKR